MSPVLEDTVPGTKRDPQGDAESRHKQSEDETEDMVK